MCAPFWTFHDGITFERIQLEGWNLLQSTPNVKLLWGQNRHDCQIIILDKIANLTSFNYVTFMRIQDGITFERIKLEGWNILQSTPYVKLLLALNRHDCQIISLACIIVIFNIVLQEPKIG